MGAVWHLRPYDGKIVSFENCAHGRAQLRVACRKRDNRRHPAVAGNDEISPGASWGLTREPDTHWIRPSLPNSSGRQLADMENQGE